MNEMNRSSACRKNSVNDLAAFGGAPAFDSPIYVGRPNIGNPEKILRSFAEVLERGWLSNSGPNVRQLEHRLAERLGVKHVVCMCNGTVALETAIRAAGLSGEVIVPSFTFIATAHALQWQEITPVFCDVDPQTHNLDPEQVEGLITPRTTGIVGVHLWGRPCAIRELEEIARRRGLHLLFDAAHAFLCTYNGKWIGGFGQAEVFSFHATKFFNTLEGGAVATNDDDLARKIRLMKNFGFTGYDRTSDIGMNGKMNEISAAMGLVGLDAIESFVEVNRRNYAVYQEGLQIPGVHLIKYSECEKSNYQFVAVEIDAREAGLTRDEIVSLLHAENVLARRYFYPGCHRMEPYRSYFPNAGMLLPKTEALADRVMCLPTGTGIDEEGIRAICRLIEFVLNRCDEIDRSALSRTFLRPPKYGETGVADVKSD